MTRDADLAERIGRLERLLDAVEQARRDQTPAPDTARRDASAERIRELTLLLQQRTGAGELDEADAIAVRALLEELRAMTAQLRAQANHVGSRLEAVADQAQLATATLKVLEDIG